MRWLAALICLFLGSEAAVAQTPKSADRLVRGVWHLCSYTPGANPLVASASTPVVGLLSVNNSGRFTLALSDTGPPATPAGSYALTIGGMYSIEPPSAGATVPTTMTVKFDYSSDSRFAGHTQSFQFKAIGDQIALARIGQTDGKLLGDNLFFKRVGSKC